MGKPYSCRAPFVLLDDSRAGDIAGSSYLFHSPHQIIEAKSKTEIGAALEQIDAAVDTGLHVAGWISYEVAGHFEGRLCHLLDRPHKNSLIWMIATKHRATLSDSDVVSFLKTEGKTPAATPSVSTAEPRNSAALYKKAIAKVQSYIQAGDVYQINHTFPLHIETKGDAAALYAKLRKAQPVPYGAYIETGQSTVLSLSPELFIAKHDNKLTARPMKGTAPRGKNALEDSLVVEELTNDEKSRAENLMIVDLIRNDLSRIAKPGSVAVDKLFEAEKYSTLFQMTSTITAEADTEIKPSALLRAMFPCGSVTGAPKVRAMEIIDELEPAPRGVYCGTIGHFSPQKNGEPALWTLNVPIRTLQLKKSSGTFNIGSGIVADSDVDAEYSECHLKAKFLKQNADVTGLFETIRHEEKGYSYLERHLDRLSESARYFDIPFDRTAAETLLSSQAPKGTPTACQRVRLQLSSAGELSLSKKPFHQEIYLSPNDFRPGEQYPCTGTVTISSSTILSNDPNRQHKRLNRADYDMAYQNAVDEGHLDCIFLNEHGNLVEGAISNLFILRDGRLLTPPLHDGALPGVCRGELLANNNAVSIQSFTLADIKATDDLFLCNALRGFRKVSLVT
jgi:para-aminobenzoate synthetase/4-amino-4-deoxychorismate lyase